MPLPLIIPLAVGVGAVVAGGGLAIGAQARIKKAKAKYQAAYEDYKSDYEAYIKYHAETEARLQRLGSFGK